MKKWLKYALLSIFLFVGMNIGVEGVKAAEANAVCTYTLSEDEHFLKCSVYDNNVLCEFVGEDSYYFVGYSSHYFIDHPNFLTSINFQFNNKWKCPAQLYYYKDYSSYTTLDGQTTETTTYSKFSTTELPDMVSMPLSSETINKIDVSNATDNIEICRYGQAIKATYYIYINHTAQSVWVDPHYDPINSIKVHFTYKDVEYGCPKKIYRKITGSYDFNIALDKISEVDSDALDLSALPIYYADLKTRADEYKGPAPDYFNGCEDMSETVSLLREVYNFIKYLVPILIIGFSIIDFAKVLLSGEEKVYKEAWSKFVKRLIVGIIILIVPILLKFVVDISGALEKYGMTGDSIFCIFS